VYSDEKKTSISHVGISMDRLKQRQPGGYPLPRPSHGSNSNSGVGSAFRGSIAAAPSSAASASAALNHPLSSPSNPLSPKLYNTSHLSATLSAAANDPAANSNGSNNSSSGSYSPAAPFRFHSFPASLPRVHPRHDGVANDQEDDGVLEEKEDEGDDDGSAFAVGGNGGKDDVTSTPMRLSLRPKPMTASKANNSGQPPPSPASRRLFMRNINDDDDNTTSTANNNNNNNRPSPTSSFDNAAPLAPSYSPNQADISGDWSESTSIRSLTNEQIRMTHVPISHVNTNCQNNGTSLLNDLEEEELEDDVDTIVMEEEEEEDDLDDESVLQNEKKAEESLLSGTKLNFGSSPPPPAPSGRDGGNNSTTTTTTTAIRSIEKKKTLESSLESTLHPHTPRGMLGLGGLGMNGLESVSPIIRLPEDDIDCYNDDHEMVDATSVGGYGNCSIPMNDHDEPPPSSRVEGEKRGGGGGHNDPILEPLFRDDAASYAACSPILPDKSSESPGSLLSQLHPSNDSSAASHDAASTVSFAANDNSTSASLASTADRNNTISRPTARKVRPMPDTSAFDVGNTTSTPSQLSLGSKIDSSGFHSHTTTGNAGGGGGGIHNSSIMSERNTQRLLCPPTPIRTPAWAHAAHVGATGHQPALKRANSLISTKVLAACPPRIWDNLSQLEDSMLENDISGSTMDSTTEGLYSQQNHHANTNNNAMASSSLLFAPVEDVNESSTGGSGIGAGSMFRSLEEDGSTTQEQETLPKMTSSLLQQPGKNHPLETIIATKQQPYLSEPKQVSNHNESSATNMTQMSIADEEESNNIIMTTPVSFSSDFDNLGILGSGAFADVYKVRSRTDRRLLYAIKRTRRQFRGVKDRERAMAEVHTMKRLQNAILSEAAAAAAAHSSASSHGKGQHGGTTAGENSGSSSGHHHSKSNYGLYLLFFIRAWQQDGFFYCQTELCSRATCRHLRLSLSTEWIKDVGRYPSLQMCRLENKSQGSSKRSSFGGHEEIEEDRRLLPERAIWQICHDISRGLFHIHSYGMVHYDIKPSNIFFVFNSKWGTICKIGDFGLAGDIGTNDDGQEGDTVYMPSELLLSSCAKHPSADVFSLGLALYELAASPNWSLPREGDQWHEIRSGVHSDTDFLPPNRSASLVKLVQAMIRPNANDRPSAEDISELEEVKHANALSGSFLSQYINDVERYDSRREREMESAEDEARRRSSTPIASSCSTFNHDTFSNHDTVRRVRDMRTPTNDEDQPSFFR